MDPHTRVTWSEALTRNSRPLFADVRTLICQNCPICRWWIQIDSDSTSAPMCRPTISNTESRSWVRSHVGRCSRLAPAPGSIVRYVSDILVASNRSFCVWTPHRNRPIARGDSSLFPRPSFAFVSNRLHRHAENLKQWWVSRRLWI